MKLRIHRKTDSITFNGFTAVASAPVAMGRFVLGDPWCLPCTINAVTPGWNGSMNGAMVNPSSESTQGFDSRTTGAGVITFGSRQTFPVTLSAGQSLVCVASRGTRENGGASSLIDKVFILTCLAEPPPAGAFRPTPYGATKTIWTLDDMDLGILPNLANPSGKTIPSLVPYLGSATTTTAKNHINIGSGSHCFAYPTLTAFRRSPGASYRATQSCGAYTYGGFVARMMVKLLCDHAEQFETVKRMAQLGIDNYGAVPFNDDSWVCAGNFGHGMKAPIVFAGCLFNDAGMKTPAATCTTVVNSGTVKKFGEDSGCFLGEPTVDYPGGKPLYGSDVPYAEGRTELSMYSSNYDARDPAGLVDSFGQGSSGANIPGYYNWICCPSWPGQALAARLITGMEAAWNYDDFFQYVDRWLDPQTLIDTPDLYSPFLDSAAGKADVYIHGGTGNDWVKSMVDAYW